MMVGGAGFGTCFQWFISHELVHSRSNPPIGIARQYKRTWSTYSLEALEVRTDPTNF
jgi:hypothetical protein